MAVAKSIDIVFEDDDIVVINKPSGMLSIPDRYNAAIPNAQALLTELYGGIFVVHRLDRETSGIICFAKNEDAHRHLSLQFNKHTVTKIYHAIVQGKVAQPEGDIDLPLAPNPMRGGTMRVDKLEGKPSHTHYRVLETFKHYTYVEAQIFTGRMHQIRVHLQAIGYPMMVDEYYSKKTEFYLSEVKARYHTKKTDEELPMLTRVPLHAYALTIEHPRTNEKITISADLPKDLRAVLTQLRKHDAI